MRNWRVWLPHGARRKLFRFAKAMFMFLILSLHQFLSVFGLIFLIFAANSFLYFRIPGRSFVIVVKAAIDYQER